MGAALAFVWAPWRAGLASAGGMVGRRQAPPARRVKQRSRLRRRWGWIAPRLLDLAGLAALGGLVFLCLKLGEFEPLLYRGGLALVRSLAH